MSGGRLRGLRLRGVGRRRQVVAAAVDAASERVAARVEGGIALIRLALRNVYQGGDPGEGGLRKAPDLIGRNDDAEVVNARHMLHRFYSRRATPAEIAYEVEQYFELVSRLIWRSEDPEAATRDFFARPQGRAVENKERDLLIAAAVQRLRNRKVKKAVEHVAAEFGEKVDNVKTIYNRADKNSPAFKFALKRGSLRV